MALIDGLAWRTSTRSSNGENCVEVAPAHNGVVIRHSKHRSGGTITFPYEVWPDFLREAEGGSKSANGVATISKAGDDTVVTSLASETELRFDADEWSAFVAGVVDGEFALTSPSPDSTGYGLVRP
ncbi:DUF397 domain-containing protein [Actinokineospora inagensis]|uniref:DUF397 domain-containing protein n=1 Tax=Actinokineospora inagensis TaxID=103730 RepID=UPI0006880153|nr:DUF397 domain-containing protein [Actinokineospora inagensis]